MVGRVELNRFVGSTLSVVGIELRAGWLVVQTAALIPIPIYYNQNHQEITIAQIFVAAQKFNRPL